MKDLVIGDMVTVLLEYLVVIPLLRIYRRHWDFRSVGRGDVDF